MQSEAAAPTAAAPAVSTAEALQFHGGPFGALAPFFIFLAGVITLALSGTPDERSFWPVLVLALCLGLALARNRTAYSEVLIKGMAQPIVMLMIMAWLLASVLGVLMVNTGFVDALIWGAGQLGLRGRAFVLASFVICAVVSTSTGTSIGSILICGPLLYPAGGLLGAPLPLLAGAILGGSTFGDSISPISDTSIASAFSQDADISGTVRSRLKYVLPSAGAALVAYFLFSLSHPVTPAGQGNGPISGRPDGLPMLAVPILVITLLIRGRHLVHGLLVGLMAGIAVGLGFGLLPLSAIISLDRQNFVARSFVIDGINRALGICIFTVLLWGIVSGLEASGALRRLTRVAEGRLRSVRAAEAWISSVVGGTVLLTCHSIVAILTVGPLARDIGARFGLHHYRRANLLDLSVSTVPFILPYFIPVILAAGITRSGSSFGIPSQAPAQIGLHNFYSWAVLIAVIVAIGSGFGRRFAADEAAEDWTVKPPEHRKANVFRPRRGTHKHR